MSPVFIIGPGALGMGIAAKLARIGITVRFVGRKGPVEWKACVTDEAGNPTRYHWPRAGGEEVAQTRIVFFAVKAFDLASALREHAPLFSHQASLISIGNGYLEGVLYDFAAIEPRRELRLGSSTLAVTAKGADDWLLCNPAAETAWGIFPAKSGGPNDDEKFLASHEGFRWLSDPTVIHRRKWLFNTTLNTLSAAKAYRRNKDALSDPDLSRTFFEAYELGSRMWGAWAESREMLYSQFHRLVTATAANENSMARDHRLKRKDESEFLSALATNHADLSVLNMLHCMAQSTSA